MEWLCFSVAPLAAYLAGSIPSGLLVAKLRGVDLRQTGSGNIGATNACRVLGKGPGLFVLAADCAKGYVACRWFPTAFLALFAIPFAPGDPRLEYSRIAAGMASILGHNYPIWLKFKGGKGIATSAGVMLALFPAGLAIAFAVWLAVVALTRFISAGSIAAAASLPWAVWLARGSPRLVIVSAVIGVLAICKHRANIQRLLHGAEPRFGQPPTANPSAPVKKPEPNS